MAVAVATPRSVARAAFAGMRPKQWSKNLLLFAGLLFANQLGDATKWLEACVAFAAYCAASSAAYLANDVRDAEHDRAHPVKRLRPVASGELPARVALWLSAVLAVGAIAATAFLGPWDVLFMAGVPLLPAADFRGVEDVRTVDG